MTKGSEFARSMTCGRRASRLSTDDSTTPRPSNRLPPACLHIAALRRLKTLQNFPRFSKKVENFRAAARYSTFVVETKDFSFFSEPSAMVKHAVETVGWARVVEVIRAQAVRRATSATSWIAPTRIFCVFRRLRRLVGEAHRDRPHLETSGFPMRRTPRRTKAAR